MSFVRWFDPYNEAGQRKLFVCLVSIAVIQAVGLLVVVPLSIILGW